MQANRVRSWFTRPNLRDIFRVLKSYPLVDKVDIEKLFLEGIDVADYIAASIEKMENSRENLDILWVKEGEFLSEDAQDILFDLILN